MWMGMIRAHGLESRRMQPVIGRFRDTDLPAISHTPGFTGMLVGANHVGGSVLALTFWETAEAMAAAEALYEQARERARSDFGRSDPYIVDTFELSYASAPDLVLDALRPCVRLVRFTGLDAEGAREAALSYQDDSIEHLGKTRGLGGVAIGTDRDAGTVAVVSYWSSEREMSAATRASTAARERAGAVTSLALTPLVDQFEIVLTHELEDVVSAVQEPAPANV